MAWFRCGGGNPEPSPESGAIVIFENGEWLEDDRYSAAYSDSKREEISIDDDGRLVVSSSGSGIRIAGTDTTKSFIVIFYLEKDNTVGSYCQVGRCSPTADPFLCMTTGAGRYSYNVNSLSSVGNFSWIQTNKGANDAIFFATSSIAFTKITLQFMDDPIVMAGI